MKDALRRCGAIASEQYGLISRDQALATGLSRYAIRRLLSSGQWKEIYPRVYEVASMAWSWRRGVMGGVLGAGPGAAAFRRTAATLHGIDGFPARDIEVVTPRFTIPDLGKDVVVARTNYLPHQDITSVGNIPVTTASRALFDVAALTEAPKLRRAIEDSLNKELTTPAKLHDQLQRCGVPGRPGSAAFREVLSKFDWELDRSESGLQTCAYDIIVGDALPQPVKEYVATAGGVFLGRLDLAYPGVLVGIEVDSWEFHKTKDDFYRDRQRQNSLIGAGWRILRFTYEDRLRPLRFLTELRRTLELVAFI